VIALILSLMILVSLAACRPTPEKPFINGNNNGGANTPQATFSNAETPKTVKETIKKGNLSLDIDAEVVLPNNEDFYIYSVGNFDFGSEEFQKRAVSVFFGTDNIGKVNVDKNETNGFYRYTQQIDNGESSLTIEPQKQIATFISYVLHSTVDLSESNKYAENETIDVGMSKAQAIELAQNTVESLGFEAFQCRIIAAFGKLDDHRNDFYEFVFTRYLDDVEIVNVNSHYPSQDSSPSNDKIIVIVGAGGLWMVNMCLTEILQKTEKASVVSFQDALSSFKQIGIAKLSKALAQGTKYTVTKIQLAYIFAYSDSVNQDLMLIPAWVFICKGEDQLEDGQIVTLYINIPVNGIDGAIMN
ncbi:MAG: hypothetical protein GX488_00285, partial [Clostridiales bacterium]|nr:hypothetical protein [Clostridiales bacterium]